MIATIIYYCDKHGDYYGPDDLIDGTCPVCGTPLEAKAAINVYELRLLIRKLLTPEGIVTMLTKLQEDLKE